MEPAEFKDKIGSIDRIAIVILYRDKTVDEWIEITEDY